MVELIFVRNIRMRFELPGSDRGNNASKRFASSISDIKLLKPVLYAASYMVLLPRPKPNLSH